VYPEVEQHDQGFLEVGDEAGRVPTGELGRQVARATDGFR
jgi:hypothetical protein